MVKIDIVSGFLGAGKTTLIRKLLKEALAGEQVVLIENEFGEIGVDGSFLKESGIEIREMNSGCICCSLVGDFGASLREVVDTYHPDRILIEPSGVGKLSDVIKAVQDVQTDVEMELNSYTTVVDAKKCKMYMKNFGEFFNNQIQYAGAIIMSRTDVADEKKISEAMELLRSLNANAAIITTPIDQLEGKKILEVMEHPVSFAQEMLDAEKEHHHHHDHDHHDHDDHDHDHDGHDDHDHYDHDHDEHDHDHDHDHHDHDHHDHDHDHHDHDHDHHDHDHDDHDHDHDGHDDHDHDHHDHDHHDHDHDEHGHHHHHHHHGHDADEIFISWGHETVKKYSKEELEEILNKLSTTSDYGNVLRAKGMVAAPDGSWIYFDMVPEETEIRQGAPDYAGRFCVIGAELKEDRLEELFGL